VLLDKHAAAPAEDLKHSEELLMHKAPTLRAVDAFSKGLQRKPVYSSEAESWGGLSVCEWNLPWVDGFELAQNNDFVIAYHSAGSRRVRAACNGPWSETRSTPGLISVIPPGRRVEYRIDGAVSFSSVHIPGRTVEYITGSRFLCEPDFRFAFQDDFASACMDSLLREAHSGGFNNFPLVNAVTRALLLHLTRGLWGPQPPDKIDQDESQLSLESILTFIDSRLEQPLKLDDLAGRAGLSRAHFVRRFSALYGVSPHRYLTLRRVERAKDLLLNSHCGIARIAQEVGFNNQSHFTQVFHAVTGATPGHFREQV
jgi:AraC family transcriptional regulator